MGRVRELNAYSECKMAIIQVICSKGGLQ